MPFLSDLRIIESRRIAALAEHWTRLKGNRPIPLREAVDPADIKELLPNIMLVDIEPAPFRVHYRLVGTEVVAWSKFDFTGRYLDEVDFSDMEGNDIFTEGYRQLHRTGLPQFARIHTFEFQNAVLFYECALLPLSSDGTLVDKAIAIEDYEHLSQEHLRQMPASSLR